MKKQLIIISAILAAACSASAPQAQSAESPDATKTSAMTTDTAIFAGGCFWCVESDFEHLPGVIEAVSGYTGGDKQNPTYRDHGQHIEAAKITFDPSQVTYRELVDFFWTSIDPTDPNGQFCDRGHAYTTAVFARPDQIETAQQSKNDIAVNKPFDGPIVTPVLAAKTFWDAEGYHQDYYKKNSLKYKYYRNGCGRDKRIKKLWGDQAPTH